MSMLNLKIDGKANEWGESFAASNKRTSLLYSLANDDKNLYLVIKAPVIINKNEKCKMRVAHFSFFNKLYFGMLPKKFTTKSSIITSNHQAL